MPLSLLFSPYCSIVPRCLNAFQHFAVFTYTFDPFYATGLFIHPKNIKKRLVFSCFQNVLKENSGMKWVKEYLVT